MSSPPTALGDSKKQADFLFILKEQGLISLPLHTLILYSPALVLDEADRILDMGFSETLNAIVEHLPTQRQTLLFSATQTKSVKDLARLSLKDPEYVWVHEQAKFRWVCDMDFYCVLRLMASCIWCSAVFLHCDFIFR